MLVTDASKAGTTSKSVLACIRTVMDTASEFVRRVATDGAVDSGEGVAAGDATTD